MLCPGGGPPVSETADLHIGPTMVSGMRPLHPRGFLPERRSSRVPFWPVGASLSPRVVGFCRGMPLVLGSGFVTGTCLRGR